MEPLLLSIIIPMYKVEPFIEECLDSILTQNYSGIDIEVIAIDDGSPDRSGEIALQYAEKDHRLKVITQKNGGLSIARNKGLDNAKGDYVWFVDSDDYLAPGSIQKIADMISAYSPEGVHLCGADIIEGKPKKLFSLGKCTDRLHTGMEMLRGGNFHGVVQYTVYSRSFLNRFSLRFMEGIYHEDTEFSPRAYYFLRKIASIDKVLYLKRVNEDSITRTVNPKKNYDLVKISKSLQDFASKIPDQNDRSYFMRLSSNAFKVAMTNETRLMDKKTRKKFNAHLKENSDLLKSFFNSDRFISKIEGTLLSLMSGNMIFVNNTIFHNPFLRKFSK